MFYSSFLYSNYIIYFQCFRELDSFFFLFLRRHGRGVEEEVVEEEVVEEWRSGGVEK